MKRVEKTVFISYRRTNVPWALAVYHNLTNNGFDVFFDFTGIASGDFETVILENIKARAHFIVVLTPSALERCKEPGDWLRREIEAALEWKRNVVPLMVEGFDMGMPSIASQLTGKLSALKKYNGLSVPAEYFMEAMARLRERHLNVALEAVIHPPSAVAAQAARQDQAAASRAHEVEQLELTAQQWFEHGFNATDPDEELRCFDEAIRLKPDYADAYYNRGVVLAAKGDWDGAIQDYSEAIRLEPRRVEAYNNRGIARQSKRDLDGALRDYSEAIRLKLDYADAYNNRGAARHDEGDLDAALQDYSEAIRLKPDLAEAYYNRARARQAKGDVDGALQDYTEAIRVKSEYADAHFNRAGILVDKKNYKAAIADYQSYLELGGGVRHGDQAEVEQIIGDLEKRMRPRVSRGNKPKQQIDQAE